MAKKKSAPKLARSEEEHHLLSDDDDLLQPSPSSTVAPSPLPVGPGDTHHLRMGDTDDYPYEDDSEEERNVGNGEPSDSPAHLNRLRLRDPRFNPPPPSMYKRIALLIFIAVLFYVAIGMRKAMYSHPDENKNVVYAKRYSREHKFRPAASPVITETLSNGKTRLRGATPTNAPELKRRMEEERRAMDKREHERKEKKRRERREFEAREKVRKERLRREKVKREKEMKKRK